MKKASPELIFVGLILFGVGISGWFYGIHWKRVASGAKFSQNEKLVVQLQDQIDVLTDANEKLSKTIRDLSPEDPASLSDKTTVPAARPRPNPLSSDSETVVLPR